MKSLTIGLPVYNAGSYLRNAIQSIINQTFKDFDLIIVDDGSSDESVQIIKSFNDPRIIFIQDGKNLGLPSRLNQIAHLAKSKFLMRMDADDIMVPNRVEKQMNFLENNPDVDIVGSNCYTINENNEIIGQRFTDVSQPVVTVKGFIHPTIVGKTTWFLKNPYDERMLRSQDYELWLRTAKFSKFCRLNTPLLYYREVGGDYHEKYFKSAKNKWYVVSNAFKNRRVLLALDIFLTGCLKALAIGSIYSLFSIFRLEDRLLNNRNLNLSEPEKANAQKMLREAIA